MTVISVDGAGKSTLLRALIGQTGQGGITLFGEAVAPQNPRGQGGMGRAAWPLQHADDRTRIHYVGVIRTKRPSEP